MPCRTSGSKASRSATSWPPRKNKGAVAASVGCALSRSRTVNGDDVAETFDDAIRPRLVRAVTDTNKAAEFSALEQFRRYFDVSEVTAGTEIVFACDPAGRLTASVGGDERPPIDSRALCRALFDVYLGEDAISDAGKKRLIVGFTNLTE